MKQPVSRPAWFVYMLRCADGTLYTGITTDVDRRLAEHNGDQGLGARYTRSRRPVTLAYVESAGDRAEAARREAAIKQLDRACKLALCAPPA
jgi:putative endonuclease